MATMRTLISKLPFLSLASRSSAVSSSALRSSTLFRLRPLILLAESCRSSVGIGGGSLRCFSTRPTNSSLNDPSPNWSNRPPKETILLDGCDFEHWLIVVEPPEPTLTRDEIIQSYISKLAEVVGSEEEARMKIYSVSTKHYFAFGALVSEELSYKIKPLAGVRWVLPDSYLNVREKDYGGEPFINGEAVPYDPKYHEEWVRNNARANERSRRNDRPRNQDRSRNFERRRENMQTYQNREAPQMNNQGPPNPMPPPPMSYQNRETEAPPMNNQGPPNPMPPPMSYQNREAEAPPMNNQGPPSSMRPPPIPINRPTPNRDYNAQSGYAPNRDVAPGYNGGGQGYQGSNPGGGMQGGGPAYQGGQQRFNQPGYQGGGPAYQGGGSPYQGSRQGGSPAYQGGGQGGGQGGSPAYQGGGQGGGQGGSPAYQGGGQGGGPAYQGGVPTYQGGGQGGGTAYQGGGPAYQGSNQGGGPAYQGGGPSYQPSGPNYPDVPQYQGREVPGRDSQ